MGEKQEILERVLLLMKYDNKKTLSENRGVIVEQYSVKTLIDKIDSNYKSGNKITKDFKKTNQILIYTKKSILLIDKMEYYNDGKFSGMGYNGNGDCEFSYCSKLLQKN